MEEGASAMNNAVDPHMVSHLCAMFPDACPNFIRRLCINRPANAINLSALATSILNVDGQYPKRSNTVIEIDVFPENQLEILQEFLPDADPDYFKMKCESFAKDSDKVMAFINEAMKLRNYPTLKDYRRRHLLSSQQLQYTSDFSVKKFVKVIPDPQAFFLDPNRTVNMDEASSYYALTFLRNTFNKISVTTIQSIFRQSNSNLTVTVKQLKKIFKNPQAKRGVLLKLKRKTVELPNSIENIPLLQEIAYLTHKEQILAFLEKQEQEKNANKEHSITKGIVKTCSCCFDSEVCQEDVFTCENGCEFCKSCIVKSTEVLFGQSKLSFPCLRNCTAHFSLQTLQLALPPNFFSKIAQKKAIEEVEAAGVTNLEFCPFCNFATIPAEGYSIFSCLNPECMKESCRTCKKLSHAPYRCEEIENDEEVKARTYIENKMTEGLLKKCYKCGIQFFKEEGCNRMTCSCGAKMCYLCGSPVEGYKHFNGNGGDRLDLCPLYSNTHQMHKENVLTAAETAKTELGFPVLLKDPTTGVKTHYMERAKAIPLERYLVPAGPAQDGQNDPQNVRRPFRELQERFDEHRRTM